MNLQLNYRGLIEEQLPLEGYLAPDLKVSSYLSASSSQKPVLAIWMIRMNELS